MFKVILLPLDVGSPASQKKAAETAIKFARLYGAEVHAMTVVPDIGPTVFREAIPKEHEQASLQAAKDCLLNFLDENMPDDITVRQTVCHGTIYKEILDIAATHNADLIVMASHRPELKDYLIGPNASRVTRHANCSVLVVR